MNTNRTENTFTVIEYREPSEVACWLVVDQWGTPWKAFRTLRSACKWVAR